MHRFSFLLRTASLLALLCSAAGAQPREDWSRLIGSAYFDNASYAFLQRLCDEAGGRLTGSPENERALGILTEEMGKQGCAVTLERFRFHGFVRGDDVVEMLSPLRRRLRAVALGNVDAAPRIDAELVYAKDGREDAYTGLDVAGRVVLVTQEHAPGLPEFLRSEAIAVAARKGAKCILFIMDKPGGITMAGMANFQNAPSPIPAFSITLEEGKWLQRLADAGTPVRMGVTTRSLMRDLESANAVVTFPGVSAKKIVVGAHFDGWDVGQGAIDNGIGTAILFDVARVLAALSPRNTYTVECVWFNGEEIGLTGAKRYVEKHDGDSIIAMLNMDMTGSPTAFSAGGTAELVPFLEKLARDLNGFAISPAVGTSAGTNSDHQPFMLHGIPTLAVWGKLDPEMVRHYHDLGDSFDKVNKRFLADGAAVVSVLVKELANTPPPGLRRRSREETVKFLQQQGLEERLRKQKEWIFD
jgi:Iap family predicted aminopeptidase